MEDRPRASKSEDEVGDRNRRFSSDSIDDVFKALGSEESSSSEGEPGEKPFRPQIESSQTSRGYMKIVTREHSFT